jgi:uncharacterized membrane protein
MDKSVGFRLSFLTSIVCLVIAVVLNVTFFFTDCGYYYNDYTNYSCSFLYRQSYYYECSSYGTSYCCNYSYSSCGDSNCVYKPYIPASYSYYKRPCFGFMTVFGIFYVAAFISAIVVFFLFRKLRAKAQEGDYLALNPNLGIAPSPYANHIVPSNNVIVYEQERNYSPSINASEREK